MADDDNEMIDDLEREDYDHDEDDEEEEEEDQPAKKKKRLNPFIDVEAAVEDEDEDDDIEEDDEPDGPIADEEGFDEEANKDYLSDRVHREVERNRRRMEDEDAEKVAEALNERYRTAYIAGAYRGDTEHIPQQMLMPDIKDPKLYLLKCVPGKERDIVWNIMRKYMDYMTTATPLLITSAFAKDNLKGYFYMEADKEAHVRAAVEGLRGVYGTKISMVPPAEMVPSLTIKTTHKEFEPGAWVRIRVGKYKGHLARIEAVEGPESLYLKLVPRIDLPKEKEPLKPNDKGGDNRTGVSTDGFLLRSFKVQQLDPENINPTLEEVAMFNVKDFSRELKSLPDYVSTVADFSVGETVMVKSGGYRAKILSIERDSIKLQPLNELGTTIVLHPADISKHFSPGEHVKVVNGLHRDKTGLIVHVKDQIVSILSDLDLTPFEVLMKDLKLAADVQTTASLTRGKYDVHDLVDLPSGEVAIILRIDQDLITVMNQYGTIFSVKSAQITVRRMSKNAVTNDSKGNPLRSSDQIEIADNRSPHHGKRAMILHVFRSLLFCQSREMAEHNGIFVIRASSTISTRHIFINTRTPFGSAPSASFGSMPFGGQLNNRGNTVAPQPTFLAPRKVQRNAFVDRNVRIVKGPYKGYMATIMDINPPKVRLMLNTNNKVVNCHTKEVQHPDNESRTLEDETGPTLTASSIRQTPQYGQREAPAAATINPFGGRTPAYSGSRTPAYGGRTPGYNPGDSGRTPAWQPGSRTPGYGDGGRTPAWDAGSKTPGYRADGFEGNRTPAPAWDAGTTPRVFDEEEDFRAGNRSMYGGNADRGTGSRYESQLAGMGSAHNIESPWPNAHGVPAGVPETPGAGAEAQGVERVHNIDWASENIEVVFVTRDDKSFANGRYDTQEAIIVSVQSPNCTVRLRETSEEIDEVPIECLDAVRPERKDTVKIMTAAEPNVVGMIGQLLSIDAADGVVKTSDGQMKIIPINDLAKFVRP